MESILTRKSVRTFTGEELTLDEIKVISDFISHKKNLIGPNGNKIRIILKETHGKIGGKVGTYGVIKKAPAFLIAICRKDKDSLFDCGFVFENLVLYLEEHGLGTCMLGSTFKRDQLMLKENLMPEEFIPIVSPVGKKAKRPGVKELAFRKMVEGDKRLPFDELFFRYAFGLKISHEEVKRQLEYVRRAPSASNKQPWRVVMDGDNQAHFFIERTPGYDGLNAGYDIQWLDMGIAVSHYMKVSEKKTYVINQPSIPIKNTLTEYVCSVL